MANHASHAALPYPVKNARFTLLIPYLDADGDPTDPTTPDTELSGDDGAAADTAEEVSSPKNSVGMLTLTGAETNYSCVSLAGKAASGPKTTLATLYPRALPIFSSGTLSAGSAGGGTLQAAIGYDIAGCIIRTTGGTGGGGTGGASNQARVIATYTQSSGAFTVVPNWETTPSTDTTYDLLLPSGMVFGALKALNPTTAGRTLDVTSTGEGGIDWANIGGPTTSVNLSGTTVKTATDVETDTQDIQSRLPAALSGGNMKTDVLAVSGDTTAADNAESFFDGTGYAGTNNVIPTVTTLTNKTGFALSAAGVQAIWDALTSALTTVGSIGKVIVDNLNATISSRSSHAAADVWAVATRILTAATNITSTGGTTVPQTGDSYARLGAPSGASVSADVAAVKADTGNLVTRITSTLFAGITSLAEWLGLLAGKQTGDATARTELRATGAGSGTYNETTDSLEAVRDRGDAAWADSGTPPTAAAIADAVWEEAIADHSGTVGSTAEALADAGGAGTPPTVDEIADEVETRGLTLTAAYDAAKTAATQASVDDLPTNAELATALASADDAVLAAIAALNNLSQANIRTAVGLATANLDTQLDALPTNAELSTALAAADDAVLAAIAALNNLSQANVRSAVGLGSANLDTQLDALPTNAELAAAFATADDAVLAAIAALNDLSAAQVNAQVVDALATDTYPEPAGVPGATATLMEKINFLAALARNKQTLNKDTGAALLRNDADSATIASRTDSDDGTTYTRGEFA